MAPRGSDGFSLRAGDAQQGGGIDGALATITEIEFVEEFDYGGRSKAKETQAALRVVYEIDGFEKPWEQHYTLGKSRLWSVTNKGNSVEPTGKQTGLNNGSNCYRFLAAAEEAIEKAGLDVDDFHGSGSIEHYEGQKVVLGNIPYKTMDGDEKQLIVITGFGETDKKKANGKTAKTTNGTDIEAKADGVVVSLLEDTPKIKRTDLANAIYQASKKDADVKAMMQLAYKDSWVGDDDRSFTWDRKKNVITAKA